MSAPRHTLYRIALGPDPLAWPPWDFAGGSRYDDPKRAFRVLYAATQRVAAFIETLARFRAPLGAGTAAGRVPAEWLTARRVVRFAVTSSAKPWLNVGSRETIQSLRGALAPLLVTLEQADFDLSHVAGAGREVTQAIARWAYAQGYAGIRYPSRFDPTLELWAIFEGATFAEVEVAAIGPDDPDLLAVARLFRLTIEQAQP